MKTEKTLFIAFSLLFINSLQGIAQSLPVLKSHSTLVSVRDGNDLKKGSWSIDPKIKPDIYNATVTGKYKWITFITDCDSLKFKVKTDKKYQFIIVLNEKDSAFTQINAIKPKTVNSNPNKAKFVTKDIHRFWKAYDKAYSDTIEFDLIFKKYYFDKGSLGMNDYVRLKIKSLSDFTSHIKSAPRFYQSIRGTTIRVDDYKKDFLKSFQALKGLYAPARFPDVYFVIG